MRSIIIIRLFRSHRQVIQMSHLQLGFLLCLAGSVLLMPPYAQAQMIAPAPLPPEAEAAMKKGIIAAKEQEWLIAIQSFQDARKTAPESPVVFYNLGLAESKIPGRELRAVAWFGAYLTASPDAPNAAAVNEFIAGLQIKNQGNLNRLIKTAQDAASQPGNQDYLDDVARLWLEAGDLAAALKTVDLNNSATNSDGFASNKGEALSRIAAAQAKAGDMAGARKTFESALQAADIIQSAYIKGSLQRDIALTQANSGDIGGAQKTVASINYSAFSGDVKSSDQSMIAEAQEKSGDVAGAKETLAAALKIAKLKIANSSRDANDKCDALMEVVKLQLKLGDIPGAKETLAGILKAWNALEDRQLKATEAGLVGQLYYDFAKAQLKAGDFAGARESITKYAASHPDPGNESMTKWLVGSLQKEIDDAQGKVSSGNKSANNVNPAIVAQAPIPAIKVSDWVSKLDDQYSICPLNTEPFLDLAGYLTAQHSDDPHKLFYALKETAEKIIKAQNVINKMLKQQAR